MTIGMSTGAAESGAGDIVFGRYRARRRGSAGIAPADEMLDPDGVVRPAWDDLVTGLEVGGPTRLRVGAGRLATAVADDGIVYNVTDGEHSVARDWLVDAVPLIVDGVEWARMERALAQRSTLLDLVLQDLYGDQELVSSGLIEPEMVYGHPGYLRKAMHLRTPGPHALFLHAVDLARRPDGQFVAYADHTGAPSGIGFALADRRLLSRAFGHVFHACAPRPTTGFVGALRLALTEYAPPGADDPTVVVLSPGSLSETAFDQAYLAAALGVPLVTGDDLTVRDGALYLRSLGGLTRVHVVLRRVDAEWTDPLDLRAESHLGIVGLTEAVSRGTVTVVNTLGSAVVENPALHTVLDRLARALLDEDLLLGSVPTLWAGDELQRSAVLARIDSLVLTNVRTGEEAVGALLDASTRADLSARIADETWQWVGRDMCDYSVAPTAIGESVNRWSDATSPVRPAGVSVRAYTVAQGSSYAVMPGGLGSVLADGAQSSALQAIAAKDVWVTSDAAAGHATRRASTEPPSEHTPAPMNAPASPTYSSAAAAASPRVLGDMFWFGRYAERTEQTVRMVRAARERYADHRYRPWASGSAAMPLLLHAVAAVTGTADQLGTAALVDAGTADTPSPDQADAVIAALAELTAGHDVPGTVGYSLNRLSALAHATRDQMSTSIWMVLGPCERSLGHLRSRIADTAGASGADLGADLARTHDDLLRGMLALVGVRAESMVNDSTWLMADLGCRVERALTLADLLGALLASDRGTNVEVALLESLLVATESAVIYRRRHRGLFRPAPVLELLLCDPANPRSMIHQIDRMRADLQSLDESVQSTAALRVVDECRATVRRCDPAELVTADPDGIRTSLLDLVGALRLRLTNLSDVLVRTRFDVAGHTQPLSGVGEAGLRT